MKRFAGIMFLMILSVSTTLCANADIIKKTVEITTPIYELPDTTYPETIYVNYGEEGKSTGGAIKNESTIQYIRGIIFRENHAKYGAAIYVSTLGSIGEISDSQFIRNTDFSGGAIYEIGTDDLTIKSSVFTENNANADKKSSFEGYGGAIYKGKYNRVLSVINSTFSGNVAHRNGGAIAMMRGDLNIIADGEDAKTEFKNNHATLVGDNDIYMGNTNQKLTLNANDETSSVIIGSGIDFNKGLTIDINNEIKTNKGNYSKGVGTVYLTGNVGSDSKRANFNLFGGTLSLVNDMATTNVYAGKLVVLEDTKMGFDINLTPYDESNKVQYDIFNFSSLSGTKKIILTSDSFNIMGDLGETGNSVIAKLLIGSSSAIKNYVQMYDKGKRVGVLYKYDGEDNPIFKIRMNPEGQFIISNPYYIDQHSNPLAYAVNYDKYDKEHYESPDVQPYYQLNLTSNITIDSWEDLPNAEHDLEKRNIQQPLTLDIIAKKQKTITAIDNLEGMVINDEEKKLNIDNVTFLEFENAITNDGGNVTINRTGFKNNVNKQDDGNGAALSNLSGMMSVTGTKSSNKTVFWNNTGAVNGGAIYNSGDLKITYADFGKNATKKETFGNKAKAKGGAIFNKQYDSINGENIVGNLKIENSNFVDNSANDGGAIYNEYKDDPTIASITVGGNFRRNTASVKDDKTPTGEGGAIFNKGYLTSEKSTFGKSGKTAEANTAVNGGAVANEDGGHYVSKMSNYYSNIATGTKNASGVVTEYGKGGAIYNKASGDEELESTVTVAGGNFTSNQADYGGAIYNDEDSRLVLDTDPTSGKITTFSKNISKSGYGGAIYNLGIIAPSQERIDEGDLPVAGKFTTNKATFDTQVYNNVTKAQSVDPNFYRSPYGGAIYNEGTLEINQGNIASNSAMATVNINTLGYEEYKRWGTGKITKYAGKGGAIYSGSDASLYLSSSTFSKNTAAEAGGAVYNEHEDAVMFLTNGSYASNKSNSTITTVRSISLIDGVPKKSKETTKESVGKGGAIYSAGAIDINNTDINVNKYAAFVDLDQNATTFTSNSAVSGGAIYTEKGVSVNNSTFNKNSAKYTCSSNNKERKEAVTAAAVALGAGSGGAIFAKDDVTVTNSSFRNNKAGEKGGAIYTANDILINTESYAQGHYYDDPNPITTTFSSNSAKSGGAVYAEHGVLVKDVSFTSNKASEYGGAIYANEDIVVVNGRFDKNSAEYGGALYVAPNKTAYLINTDLTNNKASKEGGAVYADEGSTVYLKAWTRDVNVSGNKAGSVANSFYLNNAQLNIDSNKVNTTMGTSLFTVNFSDGVKGVGESRVDLYGKSDIAINISKNCRFDGLAIHADNEHNEHTSVDWATIVSSTEYGAWVSDENPSGGAANTHVRSVQLNIGNESLFTNNSLDLGSNATVNIANNQIGSLDVKTFTLQDGTVTNVGIDMDLKRGASDKITAETVVGTGKVNVASVHLTSNNKNPVNINVGEGSVVDSMSVNKAETAEATYKIKSSLDRNGHLMATAYGQRAKATVLAAPVAAQLGGYLTQINSYDQAFMNMDMNMTKTLEERQAEMSTKFAYQAGSDVKLAYSPQFDNGVSTNGKGLWTRPYATFERVNLSNGPKVGNIAYGNFFGGDADLKDMRNGWKRQFSAYIGYNGSVQDFDRQSIDQNGGTIGITEVWYKNNFFTGLTVNVGANAVNASTDIGHENFPMLMAGVASKTGYNFEFKRGRFIIQPSLLLSYSFVHTFSHNNGRGSHVGSSPLNAIQVAPGLKFIANLPKGWQPYIGINMRWNIIDKTHFSLPDVNIPDMSVDPYVEYGVGLQRKWGDRFTGFGQAMIRNGGRNGIMLSFGFKWALGK